MYFCGFKYYFLTKSFLFFIFLCITGKRAYLKVRPRLDVTPRRRQHASCQTQTKRKRSSGEEEHPPAHPKVHQERQDCSNPHPVLCAAYNQIAQQGCSVSYPTQHCED